MSVKDRRRAPPAPARDACRPCRLVATTPTALVFAMWSESRVGPARVPEEEATTVVGLEGESTPMLQGGH